MTSARRVAFLATGFFLAVDFFFIAGLFFTARFFGAAFFVVFFRVETLLTAADFFKVGFFLPALFFLRDVFFLAMGKVYQIFLPLRSKPPVARFRNDIPLHSMQRGSARKRPLAPPREKRARRGPRASPLTFF